MEQRMKKYSRVYVEITNICNRNCSFCPGTTREKERITPDRFRTVCERLVGLTDYIYLHIMGEPTTHPDLPELITIAREHGFKVAITTNGTRLRRVGESLIERAPYKVNISIHSFEEGTNDEYMTYINDCLNFAERASEKGILTILRLWNRGYDEGINIDTLAILKERFSNDWVWGERGARIRHRLHLEYGDRFDWPDMSCDDLGERVFCHGLGDHFGILVDGTVVPCCLDREGDIPLGNIYCDTALNILDTPRARAIFGGFKDKYAVEQLCQRCGYARRFKV